METNEHEKHSTVRIAVTGVEEFRRDAEEVKKLTKELDECMQSANRTMEQLIKSLQEFGELREKLF